MQKFKKTTIILVRDVFYTMFVLFVVFSFMELIKPKIVLSYINLNLFLVVLLLLGVITIAFSQFPEKESKRLNFLEYLSIILFSILIGVFVFYLTSGIGLLSILIGIASVIICYFLIVLIIKN